jgi:hypothetical protein
MSLKSELRVNRSREVPNRVRLVSKREFASTTKTVTLILVVSLCPVKIRGICLRHLWYSRDYFKNVRIVLMRRCPGFGFRTPRPQQPRFVFQCYQW